MSENPIDQTVFDELVNMVSADFVGEIIDTFLEDGPDLIEQLKQTLGSSAVDEFRRAAHSMKSNAATFGAQQLSDLAKGLEELAKADNLAGAGNRIQELRSEFALVEQRLEELRSEYS